jgi:hypothetical protein
MSQTRTQLATLARVHELLTENAIDYWLFGGWAVDFHARAVTRQHADIDMAIWSMDALREDKSERRNDPAVAAKDRIDMMTLSRVP